MKHLPFLLTLISFTLSGQKIETKKINSTILEQERNLWIYTPWQHEEFPEKKLEVIYVFDAQAREYFDMVHSTIQFMGGEEFAFLVVGVESPYIEDKKQNRNTDFLPNAIHSETLESYDGYCGGANKFLTFIQKELIPYIEDQYPTLPTRVAVGHSNGATFISYALLRKNDLFDAYIAISPNYAYDQGQLVDRLKKTIPETQERKKFLFISHANENSQTDSRWKNWEECREEVEKILKEKKWSSKIHLETRDFSETENHESTFPIGVFYGLKSYVDYQFRTGVNITKYYDHLTRLGLVELTPQNVNSMAYECFWNDRIEDALVVINWAVKKFPQEHNLYDSRGEFYEKKGNLKQAAESYKKAMDILSVTAKGLDKRTFEEKMKLYQENYERVSQ
ncbi:alpha/beta hydrolase-fold protein [Sinomicrobium sp. M5D2P9]